MNKKIAILIFVLLFLEVSISSVKADDPPCLSSGKTPSCSAQDVASLAKNNPAQYFVLLNSGYLTANNQFSYDNLVTALPDRPTRQVYLSKLASTSPLIYQNIISKDPRIANENPDSFRYYAATFKYSGTKNPVDLSLGNGKIKSCDSSGTCITDGPASTTFSLGNLLPQGAKFEVMADGSVKVTIPAQTGKPANEPVTIKNAKIEGNNIIPQKGKSTSVQFGGETLILSSGAASISAAGITFPKDSSFSVDSDNDGTPDINVKAKNGATYQSLPCTDNLKNCVSVSSPPGGKKTLYASGSGIDMQRQAKSNGEYDTRNLFVRPESKLHPADGSEKYDTEISVDGLRFNGLGMIMGSSPPSGWDDIKVDSTKNVYASEEDKNVQNGNIAVKTVEKATRFFYEYTFTNNGKDITSTICPEFKGATGCIEIGYGKDHNVGFSEYQKMTYLVRDWSRLVEETVKRNPGGVTPDVVMALLMQETGGKNIRGQIDSADGGAWQFNARSGTPQNYGLCGGDMCSEWDNRYDLAKSTDAAVRLLNDLYKRYQNNKNVADDESALYFALSAYNAGEEAVDLMVNYTKQGTGKEKVSWKDTWANTNYVSSGLSDARRDGKKIYSGVERKTEIVSNYAPSIARFITKIGKEYPSAEETKKPIDCDFLPNAVECEPG